MTASELTEGDLAATTLSMQDMHPEPRSGRRAVCVGMLLMACLASISGCISVSAPDKPIVIELNINLKVQTVEKLTPDASKTIDENKEIF